MATVSVPKRTTVSYGSGGKKTSSSSSSSNDRVAANSYGDGVKYAGGNTFVNPDGSTTQHYGDFTSPSGKTTTTDRDGNITVTGSSNKSEVGKVYNVDGSEPTYNNSYGNGVYDMQVSALQQAMNSNRDALEDAFYASKRELNNTIKDGQRQAYINQQRALKNLPQTMAAAGYTGGVTESTAANISNEYQNALTDLERTKASELARLQANLANGIADINTQYDLQMADALANAQQMQLEQERWNEELKLRQAAAALEEQRVRNQINNNNNNNTTTTTTAVAAPTTLTAANQQAMSTKSMAPLAAYYANQGWTADQIAYELNKYRVDPESAFYGYN